MTQPLAGALKKTPLHARHRALGARMVEFGGWDMPVEYSGIVDEHLAVRTRAGLFDVSHMGESEVAGVRVTISRTGYTGEDGFEVFVPPNAAERVWDAILQAGQNARVVPAGLGARDTLRLEAAMRLYGNDMDDTTTVVEADLNWI